jgi:histone chaperone ASF1
VQADPPDASKIPADDLLGVTVVLLTCSYRGAEFIRVGYYVHNELERNGEAVSPGEPVAAEELSKIRRTILADKPRVTTFQIKWDAEGATA